MPVPTVTSISPPSGHTGGRTLCTVTGTGFKVHPPPPATGPTPAPVPSVQVTIGGEVCPAVWVLSATMLRCLTPIHDPSGIPATETADAIVASDLVVENLDAAGDPVPGESATLAECYSFHRPVFDASVTTATERAIKALITELARQVHPNVQFQPHTDYDDDTGDGLNVCQFASLPGIGLVGLRMVTPQDVADREQMVVELPDGSAAVRRQPVIRDVLLTCIAASDNTAELLWLEAVLAQFARKNGTVRSVDRAEEWVLDYSRGGGETFGNREAGVEYFTAEFAIRRVQQTDMPGISTVGTALDRHEATEEIAYKAMTVGVETERKG